MERRFYIGKVVTDRPGVLDAAMELVSRYKDDPEEFPQVVEYLDVYGIGMRTLSNGIVVVFWADNEQVDDILNAPLGELPELLTDEDYCVRLLAVHRLEELSE